MKNEKDFDVNEFLSDGTPTEPTPSSVQAHTLPSQSTEQTQASLSSGLTQSTQLGRMSAKHRQSELDEYRRRYMQTPRIEDRKPVFISRSTRDRLDRIVRLLGERGMSVSGLVENLARHHLAAHESDIECWRKM